MHRHRSLARRYATVIVGVATALVLVSGLSEMFFGYREAREYISSLQAAQAQASAHEIEQYLSSLESGVRDVAKLPWGQPDFDANTRRTEFQRLMVLYPAIVELQWADALNRELLFVSRKVTDRRNAQIPVAPVQTTVIAGVAANAAMNTGRAVYGEPYFVESTEPTLRLAIFDHGPAHTSTIATLNLRFLVEAMSRVKIGAQGRAYVVDQSNHLISHPTATHVSRRLDMSAFPAVRLLRAAQSAASSRLHELDASGAIDAIDLDGQRVIASAAPVERTGWAVVIEQPRSEVLRPVLLTLGRTILLTLLGAVAALTAGLMFASRMAAPIVRLRSAASRIAGGELHLRVQVRTRDEIELLADDFNEMASRLEASYAELEAKVQARTLELSQANQRLAGQAEQLAGLNEQLMGNLEKLRERTDEAERANSAKTRFLAAASHDLRQPMHTIGLLTGVLRARLPGTELTVLADNVLASVAVMESLFGSLLDISKLDAGAVHPHIDSFRVQLLFDRLRQAFEPQAEERRLSFRMRPCHWIVRSDIAVLERIFGNLISNALRYTPQGGIVIGCRLRGDRVAVQVFDTGIGIAESHLDHIFEEFYRIGDMQSGRTDGLGLGLSIVKRSAQMLGHRFAVRSVPGRGSRFEVEVPLVQTEPVDPAPASDVAVSQGDLAGSFLVILDDDAANREALQLLCEQWNAHVVCAASSSDALTQLGLHLRAPDLIIADYSLGPNASGIAAIKEIRRFADDLVPAILLTADADHSWLGHALELQSVQILTKPATAARLYATATGLQRQQAQ